MEQQRLRNSSIHDYMNKIVQRPQKSSIWGERGAVSSGETYTPWDDHQRPEQDRGHKRSNRCCDRTIKNVREESRTGCESSSPSSRVPEGNIDCNKRWKKRTNSGAPLEIVRIRYRSSVEADQSIRRYICWKRLSAVTCMSVCMPVCCYTVCSSIFYLLLKFSFNMYDWLVARDTGTTASYFFKLSDAWKNRWKVFILRGFQIASEVCDNHRLLGFVHLKLKKSHHEDGIL